MKTSWVVFGDSHANSFAKTKVGGARRLAVGGTVGSARVFMSDFFEVDGDGFRLLDQRRQTIFETHLKAAGYGAIEEARGRLIVSLGLAAMPFCACLARSSAVFGDEPGSPNQHHVSWSAIEALRDRYVAGDILRFYRFCLERGWFAAALAAPPPQRKHPAVKVYGPRIFELLEIFEAPVRAVLEEYDCPLIGAPPETRDDEGYLLPIYTGRDVAHANRTYGALAMAPFLERHSTGRRHARLLSRFRETGD